MKVVQFEIDKNFKLTDIKNLVLVDKQSLIDFLESLKENLVMLNSQIDLLKKLSETYK